MKRFALFINLIEISQSFDLKYSILILVLSIYL